MLGPQVNAEADTASDLQDAVAEVAHLQETAEAAFQRQREAQAVLSELTAQLATVQAAEQAKALQVEQSRRAVGRVARASYSTIGIDETLMLLLSDGSQDAARGLNDLKRVTDAALVNLDNQRRMEQQLASVRTSVAAQEAVAAQARQDARVAAEQAQDAVDRAQRREDELRQRYAAELEALRVEQTAQAERELRAARAAQAAQSPTVPSPPRSGTQAPSPGAPPSAASPVLAPGSQRSTIVSWALSKVGSRYVYGADGPDAFDCSGFVSAAYAAAGISVPSYTGAQIKLVQQIPLQQARPGDMLFFFGRGAQHVAIALGDGRMVHAANPSSGVLVNNVNDPWYGERFTTAGRLLAD
jgi:cell wall-associated NlpC family hydrolase